MDNNYFVPPGISRGYRAAHTGEEKFVSSAALSIALPLPEKDPHGQTLDETASQTRAAEHSNTVFGRLSAEERVGWALEHLPGEHVLTSSFGIQSAVLLHLVSRQLPDIPVVFIDTGYLFRAYRFVDEPTDRLGLNLKVYRNRSPPPRRKPLRPARGRLAGIEAYNRDNKVLPMQHAARTPRRQLALRAAPRAVGEPGEGLVPGSWARAGRSTHRGLVGQDVYQPEEARPALPPLWEQGYVSLGDVHTTSRPRREQRRETRFFGLKRECGLHGSTSPPLKTPLRRPLT